MQKIERKVHLSSGTNGASRGNQEGRARGEWGKPQKCGVNTRKCFEERKEASPVFNAVKGISQIKTEIGPFEFISRKAFDDQNEIYFHAVGRGTLMR